MENREIIFRAWNGEVMKYDFMVARPQFVDLLSILTNETFAKENYNQKEWKVMQFTRLFDKNKKKVFESDILKDSEAHYKVYWDGTTARWDCKRLEDGELMQAHYGIEDVVEESEVVGNIFENPDFLKIEE